MDTKILLMKLIVSCPLKNAHANCPFNELRNAPITRLIEITNQISTEEINEMIEEHKLCKRERVKTLKAS
jgi:hypothetical protein